MPLEPGGVLSHYRLVETIGEVRALSDREWHRSLLRRVGDGRDRDDRPWPIMRRHDFLPGMPFGGPRGKPLLP
jgi:hypothetical protein